MSTSPEPNGQRVQTEPCAPCRGDGITYINEKKKHKCPWCAGSGAVPREVNQAFFRVHAATPFAFWGAFGVPEGRDIHGNKRTR